MRLTRTWTVGTYLRSIVVLLAAIAAPSLAQAQQATISGRVTATGTNEPLSEARVMVSGTSIATSTNTEGRYTLRNVPRGVVTVQVLRVGYQEQKKSVTVAAGEAATLDFSLVQAVVQLQEIVTTATGEQRRVELGNSVATMGDVNKKVETTPITDLGSLLVGKTAGVTVIPGSMTGAAPVVHIRGLNSLSLNNDPIYIIDGVRMNTQSQSFGFSGTRGSLINDLDPNEIEDIEIVKGPSAATLYGTDAANGVIVITTKKGHAGSTRWTWYGEYGGVDDRNTYPTDYATWGHLTAAGATSTKPAGTPTRCVLVSIAQGTCAADSITSANIMMDPSTSPYHLGHRNQYGMNASGGTDAVRFFVSGDLQEELGPYHMPSFAQKNLTDAGVALRDEWVNPEQFQTQNVRANLNAALTPKFDLNANAGFSNTNQRLPQVDNNIFSVIYSALNNPGFNFASTSAQGIRFSETDALGQDKNGYGAFNPSQIFQMYTTHGTQRFIGSTDAQWRPFSWMNNSGTVGVDLADTRNNFICRFGECPNSGTLREGSLSSDQEDFRNFSAKLVNNETWQVRSDLNLKTTLGFDYTNQMSQSVSANGDILPPGSQSVGDAAQISASNSLQTANKTVGLYIQEQGSWRDRLFLTAAVRTDQNSSFGTSFKQIYYPKLGLSWILSDESFFPKFSWLDQFRLRSSYGASGVSPSGTQALQTFSGQTIAIEPGTPGGTNAQDTPGVIASALGNPNLKPERSAELEAGFEMNMFSNRSHFDFTYYNKKTHDALINVPIAASSGSPALSQIENIGSVQNSGLEADLNATFFDRRQFGWDVAIAGSHNTNKVATLGFDSQGNPNPTIGTGSRRDSVGFPISGWFIRPYTFSDANGDGIIDPSEVIVDPNVAYAGYSVPRDIVSITNGFDLFSRRLRITVLTDYKGGFSLENSSGQFFCSNFSTCASSNLPTTPLWDQARNVANSSKKNPNTIRGYVENGQYWKLREVSAAYTLPNTFANRVHARDIQLVFSARNLHTWTSYTGVDPEENYSTGDVQTDFATTAPRTYFILRANLHY